MRLADEVLQHFFRYGEVSDDAVFERADGCDIAGCSAEHILRFHTDCLDDAAAASTVFPDSDDRGFVKDDAVTAGVDQGIRRSKVDRQIIREIT